MWSMEKESANGSNASHDETHFFCGKNAVKKGIIYPATPQRTAPPKGGAVRASMSFVVCQHFGIDTSEYSFGYVAGWDKSKRQQSHAPIPLPSLLPL